MKRFVIIVLVSIHVLVLSAQRDITNEAEVRPVSKNLVFNGSQIVYALPKNIIRIEISVKSTEYAKGPYAGYAEKFLNISEGVIVTDRSFFEISDVKMHRYSVVDSSRHFAISKINPFNIPEIQLNSDGVIIAYNASERVNGYSIETCASKNIIGSTEMTPFLDLGVKPFLIEKSETLYKTVKTDTSETQVPYTQKKMTATTTERDADEAAAFIRKLRKRRLKLLLGTAEGINQVEGHALEIMIKELEGLERSYLELFIGKEQSCEYKYYFEFEPSDDALQEQKVLCWFSETNGVSLLKTDGKKGKYDQVVISSKLLGTMQKPRIEVIDSDGKNPEPIKYGLYYRIPGRVALNVKVGQDVLLQKQMQIAQKGQIIPLPGEYLTDRNFAIYFYPEVGSIKGIYQNKE